MNSPLIKIKKLEAYGDCAILLSFSTASNRSDIPLLSHIQALSRKLREQPLPGQINVVAARQSLLLAFSHPPENTEALHSTLQKINADIIPGQRQSRLHEIPVCYAPELAPDLASVLQQTGLTPEELIQVHSEPEYLVAMCGFLPGFLYLDGLDSRLQIPRKAIPEIRVPPGSIAIAGTQCGLYSLASPGGWSIIAQTPVQLLNWDTDNILEIEPLDRLKLRPISLAEFQELA